METADSYNYHRILKYCFTNTTLLLNHTILTHKEQIICQCWTNSARNGELLLSSEFSHHTGQPWLIGDICSKHVISHSYTTQLRKLFHRTPQHCVGATWHPAGRGSARPWYFFNFHSGTFESDSAASEADLAWALLDCQPLKRHDSRDQSLYKTGVIILQ